MNPQAVGQSHMYNIPLNEVLLAAFNDAWRNFDREHGRQPDVDILTFRGCFSTTTALFEIEEDG